VENPEEVYYYNYETAQKACPKGWRLPTGDDFEKLVASGSRQMKTNKISGREFANGKLFLPLVGYGRSDQDIGFYYANKDDYFNAENPTENINGVYHGIGYNMVIFGFGAIGWVATEDKPYGIRSGSWGWACVRCVLDEK
jgi:uncharacterized protein (TIGR02145 family)